MICLGTPQISPGSDDVECCAGVRGYSVSGLFLRIYPTGIVISELEYRGATTSPFGTPKGLRMPRQPELDAVLDALQDDFGGLGQGF
jgi:hypothetical protein